ncbi:MAG: hypothetical protein RR011_05620 [Oscillospiraceae bacterium]
MKIKTIVNTTGEVVEICVIENPDGTLVDYERKAGEVAVSYLNDCQTVTNGVAHPPLKPHWDGAKWTEAATAAELLAAYPVQPPVPPLAIEKVEAQAAYTAMMTDTLMGGV